MKGSDDGWVARFVFDDGPNGALSAKSLGRSSAWHGHRMMTRAEFFANRSFGREREDVLYRVYSRAWRAADAERTGRMVAG